MRASNELLYTIPMPKDLQSGNALRSLGIMLHIMYVYGIDIISLNVSRDFQIFRE